MATMDERHWWFSTKLQESFQFGGEDVPTLLEDFMCQNETLRLIASFLSPKGAQRLFFFCETVDPDVVDVFRGKKRRLNVRTTPPGKEGYRDACLYFLRFTDGELEAASLAENVICGLLRYPALQHLNTLLEDVYSPLIHSNKDWGENSAEHRASFLAALDKLSTIVRDESNQPLSTQSMQLSMPQFAIPVQAASDYRGGRVTTAQLSQCEKLCLEWCDVIDATLNNDRQQRSLDSPSGPLAEVEYWQRRRSVLAGLLENVKSGECNSLVNALLASKSRVMRRWKVLDVSLQESAKEAKEKAIYLLSLKDEFRALRDAASPRRMAEETLPHLVDSIVQSKLTRSLLAQNYIGILMQRVSKQVSRNCQSYLRQHALDDNGCDAFWRKISAAISTSSTDKGGDPSAFLHLIDEVLMVWGKYRDLLILLCEKHGVAPRQSLLPSLRAPTHGRLQEHTVSRASQSSHGPMSAKHTGSTSTISSHPSAAVHITSLALGKLDKILSPLNDLGHRLQHINYIVESMQQFAALRSSLYGLPEVAIVVDNSQSLDLSRASQVGGSLPYSVIKCIACTSVDPDEKLSQNQLTLGIADNCRQAISLAFASGRCPDLALLYSSGMSSMYLGDVIEVMMDSVINQFCSACSTTASVLNAYSGSTFNSANEKFSFSVSLLEQLICKYIQMVFDWRLRKFAVTGSDQSAQQLLYSVDVNSGIFVGDEELSVQHSCSDNSRLSASVMPFDMQGDESRSSFSSSEALCLIGRFNAIRKRPGISSKLDSLVVVAVSLYEIELGEYQSIYERHKDNPPRSRHVPPIAGAISWLHHLMQCVEEPMAIFREYRALLKSHNSPSVKLYNHLQKTFMLLEQRWLKEWEMSPKALAKCMKSAILNRDAQTNVLSVTAGKQIVEFIREARFLTWLQAKMPPEMARLFQQEPRLRSGVKMLLGLLEELRLSFGRCPPVLAPMMDMRRETLGRCLSDGLSGVITWNSTSIDTFLHSARENIMATVDYSKLLEREMKLIARATGKLQQFQLLSEPLVLSLGPLTPSAFTFNMIKLIHERQGLLLTLVQEVEHQVLQLLSRSDDATLLTQHITLASSKRPISARTKKFRGEVSRASLQHSIKPPSTSSGFHPQALGQGPVDEVVLHFKQQVTNTVTDCLASGLALVTRLLQSRQDCPFQMMLELWADNPGFCIKPPLDEAEGAIMQVLIAFSQLFTPFPWFGKILAIDAGKVMELGQTSMPERGLDGQSQVFKFLYDANSGLHDFMESLEEFNFLFKDDLMLEYKKFQDTEPTVHQHRTRVEQWHALEQRILNLPRKVSMPPLLILAHPVVESFAAEASRWKKRYAHPLHTQAKESLEALVADHKDIYEVVVGGVMNMKELRSALDMCRDIDMASADFDELVTPIEETYAWLGSEMNIRIPRKETVKLQDAHQVWHDVRVKAGEVYNKLLTTNKEKMLEAISMERKKFTMELVNWNNRYQSNGPQVDDIATDVAMDRLGKFSEKFREYSERQSTMNAVEGLYSLEITKPSELGVIGYELDLLTLFFEAKKIYIEFIMEFEDQLWIDFDVPMSKKVLEGVESRIKSLPRYCERWQAFRQTRDSITDLRKTLPALEKLASKVMRSRHWLQVMEKTQSSLSLETDILRMRHVLSIEPLRFEEDIKAIFDIAQEEQRIENDLEKISVEWSDQAFEFQQYKDRGPVTLATDQAEAMLKSMESSQVVVTAMLTSPYIGPLKEDARAWEAKLSKLIDILEKWLRAQELWMDLEAVFSHPVLAQKLPQEKARFDVVDGNWCRMMIQSSYVKVVLMVCFSEDSPKGVFLQQFMADLEQCQKSLVSFLQEKRQAFPRFYYVTDRSLLHILSNTSADVIEPYLKMLFSNITSISVDSSLDSGSARAQLESREGATSRRMSSRQLRESAKFVKRNYITAVLSDEGESLPLTTKVEMCGGSDEWLSAMQQEIFGTLYRWASRIAKVETSDASDYAFDAPMQIALMGLHVHWTRDCEKAITEGRTDRHALPEFRQRFAQDVARLPSLLMRNSSPNGAAFSRHEFIKFQSLCALSLGLRDSLEDIIRRKVRETHDFDWERFPRFYIQDPVAVASQGGLPSVELGILQHRIPNGGEYQGSSTHLGLTPLTDRCFLMMAQAMANFQIAGIAGDGVLPKTETVKMLAQISGTFLRIMPCSTLLEPQALLSTISGCAQDGHWLCLQDVHLLNDESLQALAYYTKTVFNALKLNDLECCLSAGVTTKLDSKFAVLTTMQLVDKLPWSPPGFIREQFRTVSLLKPDVNMLMRMNCQMCGLKFWKVMGDRLAMFSTLLRQQSQGRLDISTVELVNVIYTASLYRNRALDHVGGYYTIADSTDSLSLHNVEASSVRFKDAGSINWLEVFTSASESELIARTLRQLYLAKLSTQDKELFARLLKSVFMLSDSGYDDQESGSIVSLALAMSNPYPHEVVKVESAMAMLASRHHLSITADWITVARAVYQYAYSAPGVLVTGDIGSGKSTLIKLLVEALHQMFTDYQKSSKWPGPEPTLVEQSSALSLMDSGPQEAPAGGSKVEQGHCLHHLYPGAVSKPEHMIGYHDSITSNWVDGTLTMHLRKAQKVDVTSWFLLDGPLSAPWADVLAGLVQHERVMLLPSGEQLMVSPTCKFVFESTDISSAPPSIITRCGIVHVSSKILGWELPVDVWIKSRPASEQKPLTNAFTEVMGNVLEFVRNVHEPNFYQSESGMLHTCLSLLTGILNDMGADGEELENDHLWRLAVFSILHSFGSVIPLKDQLQFSVLLKKWSGDVILPDFEKTPYTAFDYYVSDSGEWDLWQIYLDQLEPTNGAPVGSLFVETLETAKLRFLMDTADRVQANILLVGPTGSGKSSLLNCYIHETGMAAEPYSRLVRHLAFSSVTGADHIQQFLGNTMSHRQGITYGPRNGERMTIFIDDINASAMDCGSYQSATELMRQVLDSGSHFDPKTPGQRHELEDVHIIAAASYPSDGSRDFLPKQFLRQFVVLHVPQYSEASLNSILPAIFDATFAEKVPVEIEVKSHLVAATSRLLAVLLKALVTFPLAGRAHYHFSLFHINEIAKRLSTLSDMQIDDSELLYAAWRYEARSVILGEVTRLVEEEWMSQVVDHIASTVFPAGDKSYEDCSFLSLPMSEFEEPLEADNTPGIFIIENSQKGEIREFLLDVIASDSTLEEQLPGVKEELAMCAVEHILALHRSMSGEGSHIVSVAPSSRKNSILAQLALHLTQRTVVSVVTNPIGEFLESLRTFYKAAVIEDKQFGLVFEENQLNDPAVLEAINSLLKTGEVVGLFTEDEINGLVQAVQPRLNSEDSQYLLCPLLFVWKKIRESIQIIVCLSPDSRFLQTNSRLCPAFIHQCQTIWLHDWHDVDLQEEARYILCDLNGLQDMRSSLEDSLMKTLADCHLLMLNRSYDCHWRGIMSAQPMPQHLLGKPSKRATTRHGVPAEQSKPVQLSHTSFSHLKFEEVLESSVPAIPITMTTASLLQERLHGQHYIEGQRNRCIRHPTKPAFFGTCQADIPSVEPYSPSLSLPHVTCASFQHLLAVFCNVCLGKIKESKATRIQMQQAVATVKRTMERMNQLRLETRAKEFELEGVRMKVVNLLERLRKTSCLLESLYAQMDNNCHGGNYLKSVTVNTDGHTKTLDVWRRQEAENKIQLSESQLLSEREKERQRLCIKIEVKKTERNELEEKLAEVRTRVLEVKAKIDRNTMEHIRTLPSPPMLIGEVMEMVQEILKPHPPGSTFPGPRITQADVETAPAGSPRPMTGAAALAYHKRRQTGALMGKKLDRDRWAAIQIGIGDPQRYVDTLFAIPWEDKLSTAKLELLESRLAPQPLEASEIATFSKKISTARVPARRPSVQSMSRHSTSTYPQEEAQDSPSEMTLITVSKARYASEDLAILTLYLLEIMHYQHALVPCMVARNELRELEQKLEDLDSCQDGEYSRDGERRRPQSPIVPRHRTLGLGEDAVQEMEREVKRVQEKYDQAVMRKHVLEARLAEIASALDMGSSLLSCLEEQMDRWKSILTDVIDDATTVTNCVLLAMHMVYLAPLAPGLRYELVSDVWKICAKHHLPEPDKRLFDNYTYCEFVMTSGCNTENKLDSFKRSQLLRSLPTDEASQQVGCMLLYGEVPGTLLLMDKHHAVQAWLADFLDNIHFVHHQDDNLHQAMEECVITGRTLVIVDVDPNSLLDDHMMVQLLSADYPLKQARKAQFGDRELNWHKDFRLVLSTSRRLELIPKELFSHVIVVDTATLANGTIDVFGRRYMDKSHHPLLREAVATNKEILENRQRIISIEMEMLEVVSSCPDPGDLLIFLELASFLVQQHAEWKQADTKLNRYLKIEAKQRDSDYTEVASKAALLFETACSLETLSPQQAVRLPTMLKILDASIEDVESHHAVDILPAFLTRVISYVCGMLEEIDQQAFLLFMATEVWQAAERQKVSSRKMLTSLEIEFLASPISATISAVDALGSPPLISLLVPMTPANHYLNSEKRKAAMMRKPFDWLQEEQWQGIQLLACALPWFIDPVEKMSRDGKEQQWRQLCETEFPQALPLPDGLDSKLSLFQRLILLRALRPDCIVAAVAHCTQKLLSLSFPSSSNAAVEAPRLGPLLSFCPRTTPMLLLYDMDAQYVAAMVKAEAQRQEADVQCFTLVHASSSTEDELLRVVEKARKLGSWVLVEDCQCAKATALKVHAAASKSPPVHRKFRMWFSALRECHDSLPASMLANTVPYLAKSPTTVCRGVLHSMSWLDDALLAESSRPEWIPLLHNACILHAMMVVRCEASALAYNVPLKVTSMHFWEMLRWITQEFRSADSVIAQIGAGEHTRSVSWPALRGYVAEVIYGGSLTSAFDIHRASAVVNMWFSSLATSKEFELSKYGYHIPPVAFGKSPSITSLLKDTASCLAKLPDSTEPSGIHSIHEARPRYSMQIVERAGRLFRNFEVRSRNSRQTGVKGRRNQVAQQLGHMKKLFRPQNQFYEDSKLISKKAPLVVVPVKGQRVGKQVERDFVVNTQQLFALLRQPTEINLSDFVVELLEMVPRLWSKEFLRDRRQKLRPGQDKNSPAWGGFVLFEIAQLIKVVAGVRETLQAVKAVTELPVPASNSLSSKLLEACQCLQQSEVPPQWCSLAGPSSPPGNRSVVAWMHDLQERFSHVEKVATAGRDKTPVFNLGLFSDPACLLSALLQEPLWTYHRNKKDKEVPLELRLLKADVTTRDREHLREGPQEGIFVHGVYIWGVGWDKNSVDALDICPRLTPTLLPVIHIHAVPSDSASREAAAAAVTTGAVTSQSTKTPVAHPQVFQCPVYHSQATKGSSHPPLFTLEFVKHEERMALRGAHATLRAF